ncbi:hypothetical protein M378DRAFT_561936 [Amanita muscaria Koide BX008]|uniref:Uncharacterized protein n=1 Tax=Amanita muscaria (strain Koide BX008) TaxID=946122 RepID=A0A0C2W3Y6_AMAMK|nr:hypothetical protein M378DRAFT_561936 [Amanita muscaria Koide BX008]
MFSFSLFDRSRTPTRWQFYNTIAQFLFDFTLAKMFGMRPLIYLWMSSFFAGSLYPCAGHFIAEHFMEWKENHGVHYGNRPA